MPSVSLKQRQEAAAEVERRVIEFLIQFTPARELKVGDVMQIAFTARTIAFDEFTEAAEIAETISR